MYRHFSSMFIYCENTYLGISWKLEELEEIREKLNEIFFDKIPTVPIRLKISGFPINNPNIALFSFLKILND